ncbi:hypothetical protein [Actinomadura sp. NEAU-AAG7]|uniref:hypothetical protein n=1 Tax=Actinomadura sp. NEAU-AAG7 TaxID=2839640 RepID=UPI001BE3D2AB|nr:hypothetical protein [Actinomadura sp. NEAU-AAG7]MBT2213453.1 hypothetical protein [Actinomadura sp. NEAU-AAG7]
MKGNRMPEYLNVQYAGTPVPVPPSDRLNLPGEWVDVTFDTEIADAAGHHNNNGGPSVAFGPRYCLGTLDLWLVDFDVNTEIQIRSYEVNSSNYSRAETHMPHEFYTANPTGGPNPSYPRTTHHRYPVFAYVNAGHYLRFEISQWPADLTATTGTITKAQAQLVYFA